MFSVALSLWFILSGVTAEQAIKEDELFGFAQKLYRDGIYDLAAEQFRQFLRDHPESDRAGEAQFMVGEALYMAEEYASAASEFQVFLVHFPYHLRARDVWYRMAQCHLALEQYGEAGRSYLRFQSRFSIDSRAPEALLQAAGAFLQVKDLARARRALHLFMKEYPQSEPRWRAKLLQARLYQLSAAADSALILLDEVIAAQVEDLPANALFEKGKLLREMDRYDEAVESFSRVIEKYGGSKIVDQAQFQLGLVHYEHGNYRGAIPPFEIVVDTYAQSRWHGSAQLYLAHALRQAGDDSSAIDAYRKCLATGPDTCHQEAQYGLALSLANVGRTYEALEELEDVQRRFPQSEHAPQAALKRGDLLVQLGNYEASVGMYRAYILHHPEVGKSGQLQMTIGEIYEKRMRRYQRAADEYHRVLIDYPDSPLTYDAQLAIGRCYEQLGDFSRARSAYEGVVSRDPKSPFAQRARERIDWIEEFCVQDLKEATAQLLSLLERAQAEKDEDFTFLIAQVACEQLKDFDRAAGIMEGFLSEFPGSPRAAEALFLMARSYGSLARKAAFEGDDSLSVVNFQKAEDGYRRLRDGYPDSPWADDAELFLIEAEFRSIAPQDSAMVRKMIDRYQSFLDRYPASDRLAEVQLRLGDAFMGLGDWEGPRACDEAIAHFEMVSKNSPERAEAALKIGLCHQANGRFELAMNHFEEVKSGCPESSFALEAQLGMAQCYISLNQYSRAIDTYRAIVYRYPQSQLAREVRIEMGDLLAETGDFEEARESYQRIFEQGYDIAPDLHYKMAKILHSLGQMGRAVAQYEAYLEADPGGEHAAGAYYGLARVQEQMAHLEEAARGYRHLIEEYPTSPSVAEAKGRLAVVLFSLGRYEEARAACLDALTAQVADSLRIELEAKLILSSYRLRDVGPAETESKSFRKAHPDEEDYLAQFELERGNFYLSSRKGQDARLAFKSLIDDYPESHYVDDAQFGIGMAYLEEGNYEKAEEAFRSLVQNYPQSDLVPSVYLKLGNIFHLQLNFDDAAYAYQKVVADDRAGELVPTALFNLVRTYEAANRQEQALQAAQDLVRRFPDYEDALRVRIKIGYFQVELGNYAQAISTLEGVLPEVDAEQEPEVRYWIGESYYDSGKFDSALLEYLKVAYLSQAGSMWAVTAEFKAGQTYERLGRIDEAKRLYQRMIERYGTDSQWGKAAQERLRELEK